MEPRRTSIIVVGTFDTKFQEFLYLRSRILYHEPLTNVMLIDAGRVVTEHEAITFKQDEVLEKSGYEGTASDFKSLPRAEIVKTMSKGVATIAREWLDGQGTISAIIGLGGSSGTTIAAAVMRELPLTFPKLIVSTVASGDTRFYVAETDITMMYSIVDIAGLSQVLRGVIDNAAAAIVGMAIAYRSRHRSSLTGREKKTVGITMFGVTTKGADVARRLLESKGYEVCVFHATGAGGRAMERLIKEGRLHGILDLTTTEIADEVVGGVLSAGSDRLTAAGKAGIPQIVSVGAVDMVNFGTRDTVPEKFRGRNLYEHNPSVTLMRTTTEECEEIGRIIAGRLKEHSIEPRLTEVWVPLKGVSNISTEGQAFHDEAADTALFGAIEKGLAGTGIAFVQVDTDINNANWAEKMARRLIELIKQKSKQDKVA